MFSPYKSEGERPLPTLISHWIRVATGNGHILEDAAALTKGTLEGGEDWAVCQQACEVSFKINSQNQMYSVYF